MASRSVVLLKRTTTLQVSTNRNRCTNYHFLFGSNRQDLRPVASSIFSEQNCIYRHLQSIVNQPTGSKFIWLQKVCMSTLSSAHTMNCSRMARFVLCKLPTRSHSLLCPSVMPSNSNKHLLSCSYNFWTTTAHRSNYSHLSCGQYVTANSSFIPFNKLILKDSFFCYPVSSNPLNTITWRGLRGYPSKRTDKQNLDRETRKTTEVTETQKQNLDTSGTEVSNPEAGNVEPEAAEKLSLMQRFKKTYKEHGLVLVAVHVVTSAAWLSSFYTVVRCGFDIVPYLEKWNFSDKIISPFRSGGLGDLALTYLLYKLATPARYTVTIAGTNLAIRYLRKEGKIPPVPKENTIRELYKEGKEDLQRRSTARIKRLNKRNQNKQSDPLTQDKNKQSDPLTKDKL